MRGTCGDQNSAQGKIMNRRTFVWCSIQGAVLAATVAVYPAILLAEDDEQTKKIKRALESMTSADFPDNSLKEFMQLVSAQHNIKVVIDQKGLQSIG